MGDETKVEKGRLIKMNKTINEDYLGFKNLLLSGDKYGVGYVEYMGWTVLQSKFDEAMKQEICETRALVSPEEFANWKAADHEGLNAGEWFIKNNINEAVDFVRNFFKDEAYANCKYDVLYKDEISRISIYNKNKLFASIDQPNRGDVNSYPGLKLFVAQIMNSIKQAQSVYQELMDDPEQEKKLFTKLCTEKDLIKHISEAENHINLEQEKEKIIYENNYIKIIDKEEGIGHLAIIENKTEKELYLDFPNEETIIIGKNNWAGIARNEIGLYQLNQIKNNQFKINTDKGEVEDVLLKNDENEGIKEEINPLVENNDSVEAVEKEVNVTEETKGKFSENKAIKEIQERWINEKPQPTIKKPLIERYKEVKRDAVREVKTMGEIVKTKPVAKVV